MTVKANGSLNFARLAKALERIHEEQTGEQVSISIRKMTREEEIKSQKKTLLQTKTETAHDIHD